MRRSIVRTRNISRNNPQSDFRSGFPVCARAGSAVIKSAMMVPVSLHLEFLHPLDIGEHRILERVLDFAGAIGVGDAADGVLNGVLWLETENAFDFIGVDVVGAIVG